MKKGGIKKASENKNKDKKVKKDKFDFIDCPHLKKKLNIK